MSPADQVRLRHMLEAAQKIRSFTSGSARADLDLDEKLALSVVRLLEICGEAAKAIPQTIRDANPQVPWSLIGRTRDRLIHGYFNVDLDIVWQIVSTDIPPLISELERILASP
jgi:uncharacterized protein with HEPN domain